MPLPWPSLLLDCLVMLHLTPDSGGKSTLPLVNVSVAPRFEVAKIETRPVEPDGFVGPPRVHQAFPVLLSTDPLVWKDKHGDTFDNVSGFQGLRKFPSQAASRGSSLVKLTGKETPRPSHGQAQESLPSRLQPATNFSPLSKFFGWTQGPMLVEPGAPAAAK